MTTAVEKKIIKVTVQVYLISESEESAKDKIYSDLRNNLPDWQFHIQKEAKDVSKDYRGAPL